MGKLIYLFCLVQATQSTHIAEAIVEERIRRIFLPLPSFNRVPALLYLVSLFNYKKGGMVSNVFLHCFFVVSALANAKLIANETSIGNSLTNVTCGLYLAESSIPGGGMGMYTGQSRVSEANAGPSDVCHLLIGKGAKETIFDRYMWSGLPAGEEGNYLLCSGFGALPNGHYSLYNTWLSMGTQSDADLHRREGHGAGSFTLFHDACAKTQNSVLAGEEVFLNYGTNYFENRPEYKDIFYHPNQFLMADSFISSLSSFAESIKPEDLRKVAEKKGMSYFVNMIKEDTPGLNEITKLLPDTFDEIRAVADIGGAARNQLPTSIRSVDWLEENGSCIDNLKPGMSEKKERGRGAFATHSIRKGDVVVMSPLLYVFRDKLEYSFTDDDHTKKNMTQQVINYCFGHPDSPVLLWPYAPVVNLINHDSTNNNLLLRWADDSKQPDWWMDEEKRRQIIANDREQYGGSGLMLEFVASRDIGEDEEVLLDYGEAWDEAWKEHAKAWLPPDGAEQYTAAHFYNDKTQHPILRTIEDQENNPYPVNVEMKCLVTYTRPTNPYEDVKDKGVDIVETKIIWEHPIADPALRGRYDHQYLRPCRILSRKAVSFVEEVETFNYTIEILNGEGQDPESEVRPYERIVAQDLPRSAFKFFDRGHSSDVYIKNAFRKAIGMSGDIFPLEWMHSELRKERQGLNKKKIREFVEITKGILSKHVNLQTDSWNLHVAYFKEPTTIPMARRQEWKKSPGQEVTDFTVKTSLYTGDLIQDSIGDIPQIWQDLAEGCQQPALTNSSSFLSHCLSILRDIVHKGRCNTVLDSRFVCAVNHSARLGGNPLADETTERLELHEAGKELIKRHFSDEMINIAIIGAGPAGLALSNTLANTDPRKRSYRILVFENRFERYKDGELEIDLIGRKKPYFRDWITEIPLHIMCPMNHHGDSTDIGWNMRLCLVLAVISKQSFLPKVGLPINILETLLLMSSRELGVQFLFDNYEEYVDLLRSVPNLIVFDATGHRIDSVERVGHREGENEHFFDETTYDIIFKNNTASPATSSKINWHEAVEGAVPSAELAVEKLQYNDVGDSESLGDRSSVLYPVTSDREAYNVCWLKVKNFVATHKPAMDDIRDMVMKKLSGNTHPVCRIMRTDRPRWCGPFYYFETSNYYRDDIAALMKETDVGFATRAVLMSLTSEQYEALSIVLLEDSVRLLDINREDLFNVRHILEENGVGDVLTALTEAESNAVSSSAELSLFRYSPYTYTDPVASPRGTLARLLNHSDIAAFRIGDSLMSGDPVAATGLTRHLQIISDFVCALTDSCAP